MILRILCMVLFSVQITRCATPSAKIQSINVNCEEDGMAVDIQFDQAFHGVIFSKNFFSSSDCNYVNNPGKDKVHFTIRAGQCGTVQGPPVGADVKRTRRSVNDTLALLAAGANATARQARMGGDPFGLDFSKIDRMFSFGGQAGHGGGGAADGASMYENSREDQPPPEAMEFTGGAAGGQSRTGAATSPDQSAQYAGNQMSALGRLQQPNPNLPVPQTGSLQQLAGLTSVTGNQIGQALSQQVNYAQQPLNNQYGTVNGLYPAQNLRGPPVRVMSFNGAPQPPAPPNPQAQYAGQSGAPPGAYPVTGANGGVYPNQYPAGQNGYSQYNPTYNQAGQTGPVPGAYQVGQIDTVTGEEITTTLAPVDDAYAYVLPGSNAAADAERPLMRSGYYNNPGRAYNVPGFGGVETNAAGAAIPSGRQYGGDQYGGGMQQAPPMPQAPNMAGFGGIGGGQGMQMPPVPQVPDMQGGYSGGQQSGAGGYGQGMQMPAVPQMPNDGGAGYGGGNQAGGGGGYGQQGMQMPAAPQMPNDAQYGGGMPPQPALPAELTAFQNGNQNGGNNAYQSGGNNAYQSGGSNTYQTGGSNTVQSGLSNTYGSGATSNSGYDSGSQTNYDSGATSNTGYDSGSQNSYDSGAETVATTVPTRAPTERRTAKPVTQVLPDEEDDNEYVPPSTTTTKKRTTTTTTKKTTTTADEGDNNEYLPAETTTPKRKFTTTRAQPATTTTADEGDNNEYLPAETTVRQITTPKRIITTTAADDSDDEYPVVKSNQKGTLSVVSSQSGGMSASNSLPALRAVLKNVDNSGNGQLGDSDSTRDQTGKIVVSVPAQTSGGGSVATGNVAGGSTYSAGGGEPSQPRDQYDAKYETQNEPTGVGAGAQEPAFAYHEPAGQFNNEPKFGYNEPKFGYNTRMENGGADQSGGGEPTFGYHEPAGQYNEPTGRFNNEPKFGYNEPVGMANVDRSGGGVDQSGGGQEPTFGYNEPSGLSGVDRSGGGREPAFGYREPGFGYKEPGFGYKEPGFGFREPSFGYNEPAGGILPENGGAFNKDLSAGPGANVGGGGGGLVGRSQGGYSGGVTNGGGGSYSGGVPTSQQGSAYSGGAGASQPAAGAYSGGAGQNSGGSQASGSYSNGAAQQSNGYNGGATQQQTGGAYDSGSSYDSGAQQSSGSGSQQTGGASYNGGSASGNSYDSGAAQQTGGSTSQQAAGAYGGGVSGYDSGAGGSGSQQSGGSYGSGSAGGSTYDSGAGQQSGGSASQYGGSGSQAAGGSYSGAAAPQQPGGSYDAGQSQQGSYDQGQQGSGYDSGSSGQNGGSSQQQAAGGQSDGSSQQQATSAAATSNQGQQTSGQSGRQVAVGGSAGASSVSTGQQFANSKPSLGGSSDDSDQNDDSDQQSNGGASQSQKAGGSSGSSQTQGSSQQQGQDDSSSHVISGVQKGQSSSKGSALTKERAISAADSSDGGYIENVIIIQNDPLVQEVWDAARAIRCEWRSNYKKTVSTKERIALTEVQTMRFAGDDIEVWMEIQAGKGPWADPVSNIVPIGHTMTLLIGANDPKHEFDLRVGRCIAHDGSAGKSQIDLTDDNGCVVRDRIMSKFDKAKNWGAESATIAFAHFSAFKFPETTKVFIECDVEVCKRGCAAQCTTKSKSTGKLDASRHISVGSGPSGATSGTEVDSSVPAKLGEKFRRKRSIKTDHDTLSVKNHYEAVAPADLSFNIDIHVPNSNGTIVYAGVRQPTDESYCMSRGGFGVGVGILVTAVIVSTLSSVFLCMRFKNQRPLLISE